MNGILALFIMMCVVIAMIAIMQAWVYQIRRSDQALKDQIDETEYYRDKYNAERSRTKELTAKMDSREEIINIIKDFHLARDAGEQKQAYDKQRQQRKLKESQAGKCCGTCLHIEVRRGHAYCMRLPGGPLKEVLRKANACDNYVTNK